MAASNRLLSCFILVVALLPQKGANAVAQAVRNFSAVNPAVFTYAEEDVYVGVPRKYNDGQHLIEPDPARYPWESQLGNGMPNVVNIPGGGLSIYVSSFLAMSPTPPSKVGAMIYTNTSGNLLQWERPDCWLYWYNPNGKTADQMISRTWQPGFLDSNIVAVDVESLGIFDRQGSPSIDLVYLPQRESGNRIISAYIMERLFDEHGMLQGFINMRNDRPFAQKNFIFNFINADTHMNFLTVEGDYYVVSRLNGKRSALWPGETLPFARDPRKRYRRETVTRLGEELLPKMEDLRLDVALDMSTYQWEPYSLQPFQLPEFRYDMWWGLATMYGTTGYPEVDGRQRTELAYSNDGITWKYLKAGSPFLDNGTGASSPDHGCINIAKPVKNRRFSAHDNDLLYFYASSNKRHDEGRNPGISLAVGKVGKWAALKADAASTFYSVRTDQPGQQASMPAFSLYNALLIGNEFCPYVLSDVLEDPRGKMLTICPC